MVEPASNFRDPKDSNPDQKLWLPWLCDGTWHFKWIALKAVFSNAGKTFSQKQYLNQSLFFKVWQDLQKIKNRQETN